MRKFFRDLSDSLIDTVNPEGAVTGNTFDRRNERVLRFIGTVLTFLLLFFALLAFLNGNATHAIINVSIAVISFFFILFLRRTSNYSLAVRIIISLFALFSLYLFQFMQTSEGFFLWIMTAPLFLLFFLKLKEGLIVSVTYLFLNILLSFLKIFNKDYSAGFLLRFSGVYLTLVLMSYIYGRVHEENSRRLYSSNRALNDTVTKLSKTKKDLQNSKDRYQALVENSNDGIAIVRDLKFVFVNRRLSEMTGYQKKELLKESAMKLVHENDIQKFTQIFRRDLHSTEKGDRTELTLVDRTGHPIETEIGFNTIEYEGGLARLVLIRDISERKSLEIERAKISKLKSFQVIADGVTHDFNNILTIIMGNLELMKRHIQKEGKLEKPLNKIAEASGRASELLNDLYIFSSSTVKDESLEDIEALIRSLLDAVAADFPGTVFNLTAGKGVWPVRCDMKHIQTALKNIIRNSIDAAGQGSRIHIRVENSMKNKNFPALSHNNNFVRISVTDSGKGIPRENLERIFDPYFSTKTTVTEKGIGLGLAIANKIILDHNGLITVESAENYGTTFYIFLPAERRQKYPKK